MSRAKGSKNRISACVKDNIVRVFEDIGGRESMAEWAEANKDEYYRMYARLAPKEVDLTGEVDGEFKVSWDK